MKKIEYCVRTYDCHRYEFMNFNSKRMALKIAKIKEKEKRYCEVIVIKNVIGDDFGIDYPNYYGIIRTYYNKEMIISHGGLFENEN